MNSFIMLIMLINSYVIEVSGGKCTASSLSQNDEGEWLHSFPQLPYCQRGGSSLNSISKCNVTMSKTKFKPPEVTELFLANSMLQGSRLFPQPTCS